ncbi:hypothetical protein QD460_20125 [Rhizobium jaguaris]|uniref:Uncharacterized protein n=1 Tax=Rhizobium jaguaris TaxID=1312183 RepID=A0A387G2Y5_9HYPH|nr:hypothetical protein [Rhizobium jaguaris]AYG62684.1 hypothetical protein CCGE525_28490 [Rhizobium jaguaris]
MAHWIVDSYEMKTIILGPDMRTIFVVDGALPEESAVFPNWANEQVIIAQVMVAYVEGKAYRLDMVQGYFEDLNEAGRLKHNSQLNLFHTIARQFFSTMPGRGPRSIALGETLGQTMWHCSPRENTATYERLQGYFIDGRNDPFIEQLHPYEAIHPTFH